MPGLRLATVSVPFVEGMFGTGPVDLAVATDSLKGPEGFDMIGGAGELFERAHHWFVDAANAALSEDERYEHRLGSVRALNNLAVWGLTKSGDPNAVQVAYDLLAEAERVLMSGLPGADEERAAVLFNLGNLMEFAGYGPQSVEYLRRARELGID
jgi:hypothetical protein